MMEQLTIEHAIAARELRDAGIARTLEAEPEEWLAKALQALRRYAAGEGYPSFKMEDFRVFYASQGLPGPHSHKVWGGFTHAAVKAGVIRWTGQFAQAASPKTHAHWVKTWRAA